MAIPTSNALADPPGAVQFCKFLSQNGFIPNQGQCVSEINTDVNGFCQRYSQYYFDSVGDCIHTIRQ